MPRFPKRKTIKGSFAEDEMRIAGKTFTIYNVCAMPIAHTKARTPGNIQAAFKKTGIYPYDKYIFTEVDFLPSKVTDRPDPTKYGQHERPPGNTEPINEGDHESNNIYDPGPSNVNNPGSSNQGQSNPTKEKKEIVSPMEFSGLPKVNSERLQSRKNRKRGRSFIPTDTPELKIVLDSKSIKPSKEAVKKVKRCIVSDGSPSNTEVQEDFTSQDNDSNSLNKGNSFEGLLDKKIQKGDYVLVQFLKNVYYVGQILTEENDEKQFGVFFSEKQKSRLALWFLRQ